MIKMSEKKSDDKEVESCPLESKQALKWNSELREKLQNAESDFVKAELFRCLAADANFRSSAAELHNIEDKFLSERFELKYCMLELSDLTDNQSGLNNYAEPSLNLAAKFRNRSKQFKTKLNIESPVVQKFLAPNIQNENKPTDKIRKFSDALKTVELKNEQQKENKATNSNDTMDFEDTKTSLPESKYSAPKFESVKPKFGNPIVSGQTAPTPKPATPKFGLPGIGPRPPNATIQPKFPTLQRQESFGRSNNNSASNGFGNTGVRTFQNGNIRSNSTTGSIGSGNVSSNSASALNIGGQNRNNPSKPFESTAAFRTAHEELFIQANQKRGNEISGASYGTGKKTLGVPRTGSVVGSFKPPIVSKNPEQEVQPDPSAPAIVDDRLKHLDPKMVELIQSEIMDRGPQVGWSDIAGLEFAKKTVKEMVVFPLLRPDIFYGLRGPPKGLLLFGPPGTGKTLIGKCIACQSRSTFFSISASSLTSKWVGEGEKMVRTLFEVARVFQPSVVFIDEIDSLLSARSDTEHESSRRIKTEFLVQLDGATCTGEERILVVGATNRPQDLDEAARRRLVKRLYIPLPEQQAREQIVRNLLYKESVKHCLTEDDVVAVAAKAEGYSGADMSNLCKEAAMGPVRCLDYSNIEQILENDVRPIEMSDFLDAFNQVKASVSDKDLQLYLDWDAQFGSGK